MELLNITDCDCGNVRPKYYRDGEELLPRFGLARIDDNGHELLTPHIFRPSDLQNLIYCINDIQNTLEWGMGNTGCVPSGFKSPVPAVEAWPQMDFAQYESENVTRHCHGRNFGHVRANYWNVSTNEATEIGVSFTRIGDDGLDATNPHIFYPEDALDFINCVYDHRDYMRCFYSSDELGG